MFLAGSVEAHVGLGQSRLPALSVTGRSVAEGDTGRVGAVFTLRLSRASRHLVSVQVATADDSATAGSDYHARRGVIRFRPGQRTARFRVSVLGDTRPEETEKFFLEVSHPKGARLRSREATATIPENDLPAPFTVTSTLTGAGEVDETPSPTGHGGFTMTLDAAQKQITFTLSVTGMPLGDSGLCRGAPLRPFTEIVTRLGDPTSPGMTAGTKQIALKPILEIYESPENFCARATTPTRSEFIRGQLARTSG